MCHKEPEPLLSVAQGRYMQLLQLFTENTLAKSLTGSDTRCGVLAGAKAAAKKLQVQKGERRGLKYHSCFQE